MRDEIVAECERCAGKWRVPTAGQVDPKLLEGVCMECQADSDVERPLTFRFWDAKLDIEYSDPLHMDIIPKDWLVLDET
jgi:hypothetical protein